MGGGFWWVVCVQGRVAVVSENQVVMLSVYLQCSLPGLEREYNCAAFFQLFVCWS